MIIFANTLTNEVGTNGLGRMSSYSADATGSIQTKGTPTGVEVIATNGQLGNFYAIPTVIEGVGRYAVYTIRLNAFSKSAKSPVLELFGMRFEDGQDPSGYNLVGRTSDICVVHDLDTGEAEGFVGGRYVASFTGNPRINIDTVNEAGSMSFFMSNLAVHLIDEKQIVTPFLPTLIPIGETQTGWTVPNNLADDLNKNDPTLTSPAVVSYTDNSTIDIAATGWTLLEMAGAIPSEADADLEVNGVPARFKETQAPAQPVVVDAEDTITLVRKPKPVTP